MYCDCCVFFANYISLLRESAWKASSTYMRYCSSLSLNMLLTELYRAWVREQSLSLLPLYTWYWRSSSLTFYPHTCRRIMTALHTPALILCEYSHTQRDVCVPPERACSVRCPQLPCREAKLDPVRLLPISPLPTPVLFPRVWDSSHYTLSL